MAHMALWTVFAVNLQCAHVHALRPTQQSKSDICNVTSLHDSCPSPEGSISVDELYWQAMNISECMRAATGTQMYRGDVSILGSLQCLISDMQRNIRSRDFTDTLLSVNSQMSAQEYKLIYCIDYELNYLLNSANYVSVNDEEPLAFNTSQLQMCEAIRRIFAVVLYLQTSENDANVVSRIVFDTQTLETILSVLTNNTLDTKEIRKEVERVMKDKPKAKGGRFGDVKNCGFESECKLRAILWVLYTVAIAENGLLIFIFVRHREMRSDRNIIILNLAVADILSVVCNASLQIIFIYGGPFEKVKLYYRITDLSLEVSTGVCIYSIVVLSVQRYFAVIPTYRWKNCQFIRRFNSILFVVVLWTVGCVPQIIHITAQMSFQAWAMRNLILYCVIPIVAIATFYVMTSWRLRQSVRQMPGEALRQETARQARVRSSNVLIALIVVFVISYTPIQLFRFIELWYYGGGYLFDYVDLIAYSLLSLNSCFNPIALYVASATFRRYYNRYICYRRKAVAVNMSNSNINIQSRNDTRALHI
jgi:hypothetical protein